MQRLFVFACLLSVASAFMAAPAVRPAVARSAVAPTMIAEHTNTVAEASSLLALSIPIPAYSPAKAFVMMFSNVLIIW